jgi:hypothetical protein
MRTIAIFILLITLTGCVVFPTSHYIYEPISPMGKVVDPEPCGYMFSNNVLLVIENSDYKLETQAYPDITEGKLKIYFRIVPSADPIKVNFDMIQLIVGNGEKIKPISVTRHAFGKPCNNIDHVAGAENLSKATNIFYDMEFAVGQQSVEEFVLHFGEEAVSMSNKQLSVDAVKFRKSKKKDIYYGTINC